MTNQKYGWIRQLPDFRDHLYARLTRQSVLPNSVDLTLQFPTVYDQGELGSCTGNMTAAMLSYVRNMQGLPTIAPSRLMIYYGARSIEGTIPHDAGAQIRDAIKSAAQWGACDESLWPYDSSQFANSPSVAAYAAAKTDRAIGYRRVTQMQDTIEEVLAAGDPIGFGFSVYESFESDAVAHSGILPMPVKTENLVGGHAVVCVGYDRSNRRFLIRNSWGTNWGIPSPAGLRGHFWMPYEYLLNPDLAADFWTIRLISP